VEAQGFLKYMVRNIIGTLVEVGRNKRKPEEMKVIIESRDRTIAGVTAPACGLFLKEVKY
jgi:tRNA pseudouridine38-40 synthase